MERVYYTGNFAYAPYVIAWNSYYGCFADQDSVLSSELPLRSLMKISVVQADFRYLSVSERQLTVQNYIREFPPYVFEKKFEIPNQKGWFTKFLDNNFRSSPSDPPESTKIHLVIGSQSPEQLLSFVLACGSVFSGDKQKFCQELQPKLFIALDDDFEFGNWTIDLYSFMVDHGINSDLNIEVRHPKLIEIPVEKRWTKINGQSVTLPQYLYQAQLLITENYLLNPEKSKAETKWINIGAHTYEVLNDLIDSLQLRADSQDENDKVIGRESIPDDVKIYVWKRDGGRCVICGSQMKLEFDHIIPISKGGSNTARNIQLLCEKCNRSKGGKLSSSQP